MAQVLLITGGGRSGKSAYALRYAQELPGPRAFVATCPPLDEEMCARIRRHQQERAAGGWTTLEETTDLAGVLAGDQEHQVLLVDCLALWVNNLLYDAETAGRELGEEEVRVLSQSLLEACARRTGTVIFVTNEVGLGLIPDNALARRYRDLLGRCNQVLAAGADIVVLIVSGLPVTLKTKTGDSP